MNRRCMKEEEVEEEEERRIKYDVDVNPNRTDL